MYTPLKTYIAQLPQEEQFNIHTLHNMLTAVRDFRVIYGIPTFTEFESCRRAVEGIINNSSLVPDKILIVDNSETEAGAEALTDLTQKYSGRVHIIIRRENILSGAWNDIMNYAGADDYVIVANDDVFPHYRSIEALVTAAKERPDVAMWNGSGHSGNSYSFFLLRQWAYRIVGAFDENFKPAYFEDNDFDYRIKLAGLIREEVAEAEFEHIGSATINNMDAIKKVGHHRSFVQNQRYYITKWGAKPGQETFKTPHEKIVPLGIEDL